MATLKMKLEGLICHVGNANFKTHAVLVHEPELHTPSIQIGGMTLILKRWDTVSFEGPNIGGASPDPLFNRRVPSLRNEIRNGTIHPKVLNHQPAPAGVAAYIIYPAGKLSAPQAHPIALKLTLGNATPIIQCVATGVTFESDEFASETMTIVISHFDDTGQPTTTDRFTLPSSTEVIVENVSSAGNHFHEYLLLTDANLISTVEQAGDCRESFDDAAPVFTTKLEKERSGLRKAGEVGKAQLEALNLATASINPECTNSQWP